MEKRIYLLRHCEAEGQSSQSPLTINGKSQSEKLCEFFSKMNIQRIISSPFVRAVQTIERLSKKIELEIEIDKRLSERRLSSEDLPDWLEKLKVTYDDFDLKLPGGESSREAAARIRQTVDDVLLNDNTDTVIIVTHGNILSLLINQFDNHFGFDQWRKMSNPDVYLLTYPNENYHIERMWKEEYNV